MVSTLLQSLCAYIPRDRVESILHPGRPLTSDGVALIADISGFTPLTEALTHGLSPDHGAEELTHALTNVFTPLIQEIHAFHGSVIKFGGDALIVWFGREAGIRRSAVIRRALTSAWRMQQAIARHGQIPTPIGTITLRMKIGLTYGPVKRFNLGLPRYGYEDVLGGQTLDRMAEAEHHAEPGDILVDRATLAYLPEAVSVAEWRSDFAAIDRLLRPARPKPWPALEWPALAEEALIELVQTYVPNQIYEMMAAGQARIAELKPVVSLFVQFHGIDYDNDPDVGQKLQRYFATSQRIVSDYGGRLNRLITGDKGSLLHIIFGAPRTVEEQEARAVRCALELQRECGRLPFISMQRIGVSLGRVFAGAVGSSSRHDFTTMGDSINLSARLMQSAADHQVLLEEAVQRQLGPEFQTTDLGEITVKGKAAPIRVYAALAARSRSERRAAATFSIPIFGRDEEIRRLMESFEVLLTGQGGTVTLVGEVGMGKTHILNALRLKLASDEPQRIRWAEGMCLAYGQSLSGYLFIDILRDLINLPPGASPEASTVHLLDFCRALFSEARLEATYPYLARFMNLPLEADFERRLTGLSGENLRWQFFEVFREMLSRLVERRPLILSLDDLQWADPTSLQLLETILPLTADQPLLLLLAMRPDHDSRAWSLRQGLLEQSTTQQLLDFRLHGLTAAAAQTLISHEAPQLPDKISRYLLDKSGGNPLFLVELVRTMAAQGLLADGINPETMTVEALDLPNSVQGLLLAQIDRLAVEARHTLQMASVIGRSFLYRVLENLAVGEQDLSQRIVALVERDYIQPDDPTDLGLAFIFRHALIQESAYSTLLYERRRTYHRQVAQVLEQLFPTHLAEQVGLLAYHYEQAEDLERAIYFHLQAADQARLIYANEEADKLYQQVLNLLDQQALAGVEIDPLQKARIYLKVAQVRSNTLDFEGAQTFYQRAFDLFEQQAAVHPPAAASCTDGERIMRAAVLEHGPMTLDPGLSEWTDVSEIIQDLFEGLVEIDTELNVLPATARRWQVSEDGKRYRFELRKGLKWSDGTPLTASDFVFAWRRNLDPQTGAGLAHLLYPIEGAERFHQGETTDPNTVSVRAADELTLEIVLKAPTGYFPYLLSSSITFPQPQHLFQAHGQAWSQPLLIAGNGPFKIIDWQSGQAIRLGRNPFYQGITTGNLDEIFLQFIEPTPAHYFNQVIDWCRIEDQAELVKDHPDEAFLMQHLQTFFLGFACNFPPFDQEPIRRAFAKAINRAELVQTVWSNVQKPATGGLIPSGMPGHSPEIGHQFDPEAAHTLLTGLIADDALPRLKLAVPGGFRTTPQFLQASWRQHLGIEVEIIENMATDQMLESLSQGTIQLALIGWDVEYPDPDSALRVLFHSASPINYFGWGNPVFDQLVEQAASSSQQSQRLELYHQADQILVAEDTAVVPLYYYQAYGLMRPHFSIQGSGKIIRGGTFKFKNIVFN